MVAFDVESLQVTGEPVPVQDGVGNRFTGAFYSVSEEGTLVYILGRSAAGTAVGNERGHFEVVDLETGTTEVVPPDPRGFEAPTYSPEGRYVAYGSGDPSQIFVYDIELGTTPRQLTFEGENRFPVWSPDGARLAFVSERDGSDGPDPYVKTPHDDAPETRVLGRPDVQVPLAWPADDQLLFHDQAESRNPDLWIVDPSGEGGPEPYLTAEAALAQADVSPDGRWVAYVAGDGEEGAVFVRSFPEPRQQIRVSARGGGPRWSADGNTIYYWSVGGADTLFAARVRTEPSFAVLSGDVVLAEDRFDRPNLAAHPDGRRLLVVVDVPDGSTASSEPDEAVGEPERYIVVFNWFEELKQRTGGGRAP